MEDKVVNAAKFGFVFTGISAGIIFLLKKLKTPGAGSDPSASVMNYLVAGGVATGTKLGYDYAKEKKWLDI